MAQQVIGGGRVARVDAHADARLDRHDGGADLQRRPQRADQPARHIGGHAGGVVVDAADEQGELVAALACQQVARPDDLAQPIGDGLENRVTDLVAMLVVDALEVVEVDEEQRQLVLLGLGVPHGGAQLVVQRLAVGQARDAVEVGQPRQPGVGVQALGDVALDAEVLHELAVAPELGASESSFRNGVPSAR